MATAIQFLRTSAPRLRPDPVDLASGMPMINMAPEEPGLYFRLTDDTLVKIGPTFVGSVPPNDGAVGHPGHTIGEQWLDISVLNEPILKIWDGSNWLEVSGGSEQVPSDWSADIGEDGYIENKPDVYVKDSYIPSLPNLP